MKLPLIQRLRNLWRLSEWDISSPDKEKEAIIGHKFALPTKKPQIIKKEKDIITELNGD